MYKVLIADDEQIIREGLIRAIDWGSYHCEIAAQATNGIEATDAIRWYQPDIILTDIKMPGKDGLEVTAFAMECNPHVKVIILSGYSNFEYTKQALKLGAFDYILKPTVYSEVQDTISRAVACIKTELIRHEELRKLKQDFKSHLKLYRRAFLSKAILTPQNDDLNESLALYEIEAYAQLYLVLCKIDEFEAFSRLIPKEEQQLFFIALDQQISTFLESYPNTHLVPLKDEQYAIVWGQTQPVDPKDMTKFCEQLQQAIRKNYLQLSISFGISRCKHAISDLNNAYWEATEALSYIFYLGNEAIIYYDDLVSASPQRKDASCVPYSYYVELYKPILKALQVGDEDACQVHLNQLFQNFEKNQETRETVKAICMELAAQLMNTVSNSTLLVNNQPREQWAMELMNCETFQAYFKSLGGIIGQLAKEICRQTRTQHKKVVQQVIQLINKHYMEDITLSWISEQVHLNSSYISRLIKNECGDTFTELLTRCRMEQAKTLLKNPHIKIYEVSEKVGIIDSQYFASKFKKYTRLSPSEYRDHFNDLF